MMHQRDHSPLSKAKRWMMKGGGVQMKMNTKGEKGDCLHDCIYVSRKKLFPSVSESSSFQII